jgi:GT2 family glycosyltransferase
MPSISIILLNYNTLSYTEQCVKSIINSVGDSDFEIIIVENNSNDKVKIKYLEKKFKFVKVIVSLKNLGFAAGNNIGVKNAVGKYIVILNNDTIVFSNFIEKIKTILGNVDKKTIITGFIEGPDGKFQHSGGKEPKVFRELFRFGFLLIKYIPTKFYDSHYFIPSNDSKVTILDWASGCFFAMSKDFYQELNGFDENMFMYVEDVEFHKRVRLNGGSIIFTPEIKIKHFGSQSSKNYKEIMLRSQYKNTVYYFKKHTSKLKISFFYSFSKTIFLVWFLFFSFLVLLTSKSKIVDKKKLYKTLLFA